MDPNGRIDPAKPPTQKHVAMNWARQLKRVFGIEIEHCARCGGKLKIIASIEEPEVMCVPGIAVGGRRGRFAGWRAR